MELHGHPPYLCPFSYSNLEEAEGVEELGHWEAPLEGTVHPEAHKVKELIEDHVSEEEGQILAYLWFL